MDRLLYVAMTGAKQLMQAQALVAHNLANVSTTGFRADLARFEARPDRRAGLPEPREHGRDGLGLRSLAGRARADGRSRSTSRSTATAGSRCRRATAPKPMSRGGSLKVNALGLLETERGELVLGDNGPLAVPPYTQISVAADGTISIVPQGQGPETLAQVGRLEARQSRSRLRLGKRPDGLIEVTDGEEIEPDANVKIASGFIETSNVNIAATLVDMIEYSTAIRSSGTHDANGGSERLARCGPRQHQLGALNMESLWVAKTGLEAQQTRMTVVSQNLANVNTTGYKRQRAMFEDLLYQNVVQVGGLTSQQTEVADGPESRHRRARRRDGQAVLARQHRHDGQPARRRHQRPRLLRDPAAGRHAGLHARRHVPGQRRRPARDVERLHGAARDHDSARARRPSRSASTASCRPIPPGQADAVQIGTMQLTNFVNPAGLQPRGENLYGETAVERPAAARHAGLERARHADAGRARDLERQRRRGARVA